MTSHKSLRHRVARALYENIDRWGPIDVALFRAHMETWDDMLPERQSGWLSDADVIVPIVVAACCVVVDQTDPEKPANYLFKRENLSSVIQGLFLGAPDDEWECPIDEPSCTKNCGNYGCGN